MAVFLGCNCGGGLVGDGQGLNHTVLGVTEDGVRGRDIFLTLGVELNHFGGDVCWSIGGSGNLNFALA